MEIIGFVILIVFLIMVVLFVFIALCLLALGILSASTLTGLLTRRPKLGIKTFFVLGASTLGILIGFVYGCGILIAFDIEAATPIYAGGILGLLGGVFFAHVFNMSWDRLFTFIIDRISEGNNATSNLDC